MRIDAKYISMATAIKNNLDLSKGYIMTSVHKGLYGLPHAGKLSHDELNVHLSKFGFMESDRFF